MYSDADMLHSVFVIGLEGNSILVVQRHFFA